MVQFYLAISASPFVIVPDQGTCSFQNIGPRLLDGNRLFWNGSNRFEAKSNAVINMQSCTADEQCFTSEKCDPGFVYPTVITGTKINYLCFFTIVKIARSCDGTSEIACVNGRAYKPTDDAVGCTYRKSVDCRGIMGGIKLAPSATTEIFS